MIFFQNYIKPGSVQFFRSIITIIVITVIITIIIIIIIIIIIFIQGTRSP